MTMNKYTNIYELYAKVMDNADSIASRKAYSVTEDIKKDAVTAFDKLKSNQKVTIGYDSSVAQNMSSTFIVTSKNKVKMGSAGMGEKITLKKDGGKGGMKYFLYKRPDGNVSLALGDMAASMKTIKLEGINEKKDLTLAEECVTLDLDENYTPKEVKMAIGVASDPRYKQGNMTGAVNAIEKIKKGLSKQTQVAAVLRRQNEELLAYVKEGKMKNIAIDVDDAMGNIAYKLDTKGGKFVVKVDSNDEEDAQKAMKMHPLYIAGKLRVIPEGNASRIVEPYRPELDLDEAPKMTYALVGTDMKIYAIGDEKEMNLNRRSLEKRLKDVSPLKIARLKTAQSIGDKVDKSQLKEEIDLDENQYYEYKFKNKNDAMKAKSMLDGVQLMNFDINDDNISNGELMVDAGKKNMSKYHNMIMKQFKPKVMAQETVEARKVDPADIDDFATDDDIKTADNNILMQLRKSVSLRGLKDVKFNDNKKVKVNDKIAQAALNKFASIRTSIDKAKFSNQIAKSYKDLLNALKK